MDETKEIKTFRCPRILSHLEKENSTACDRRIDLEDITLSTYGRYRQTITCIMVIYLES